MINKNYLLIFSIILICILSIGAISASEDVNGTNLLSDSGDAVDNVMSESNNADNALSVSDEKQMDDAVGVSNEDVLGDPGTFTELNNIIKDNESGSTIHLTKNYTFTNSGRVVINKELTIDGHGYYIDGSDRQRLLNIEHPNVVLKNIHFVNGFSSYGSAIYDTSGNLTVINCTFDNCQPSYHRNNNFGATIHIVGGNNTFKNCNFSMVNKDTIYNSTYGGQTSTSFYFNNIYYGGAIFIKSGDNNFTGCRFTNTFALYNGSAIYVNGNNNIVRDSKFLNSTCSVYHFSGENSYGGAIYFNGSCNKVLNSTFKDFNVNTYGGAIYFKGCNNTVENSNFSRYYFNKNYDYNIWSQRLFYYFYTRMHPQKGTAIYFEDDNNKVINSNFSSLLSSYSNNDESGIYFKGSNNEIIDSNFTQTGLNAIYLNGNNNTVNHSYFSYNWNGGVKSYGENNNVIYSHFERNSNAVVAYGENNLINNSKFVDNGNAVTGNHSVIENSNFTGNYNVAVIVEYSNISNCVFNYNDGYLAGGAIRANSSNIISDCNFTSNTAMKGGQSLLRITIKL